jgi:transcriptional regulator GlxA family with amidase domain
LLVQASGLDLEMPFDMSQRAPDPRITWIVDFMHRHMSEPLTIGTLAERVNLSRSRFTALFVAQTGAAPMRYLQRARLRRARLLVERSFLTVKEIMVLVGYNDPSHFARDFRREHGVAPSVLRTDDLTSSLPANPSVDPPRKRRIGPPRARDPGFVST